MGSRLLVPLLLVSAGAASGQEPGAAGPPELAIGPPWDAIAVDWTERRYKVEAIRFKARDETGVDWLGSDEVMVETRDAKGFGVTDEIDGIDSGDSHAFDPGVSCIIGVPPGTWTLGETARCDEGGTPGPFSFEVVFWEKDSVSLDFGFCVPVGPPPGMHIGPHCGDDGFGDDFIGRRELFFPLSDLEATLPNVGDSFTETVVLSPCQANEDVCGGWNLPDYSFTYRTTRLPDVGTGFRGTLEAAMRRSGILSADDALAAALRQLAGGAPRQAEPERDPPPPSE